MENHQQLNSIQLAPPAHPTRLAYPARRVRGEEGTWEVAGRKGKEQSTRAVLFCKGSQEPSTEGMGEEASISHRRYAELFGLEETERSWNMKDGGGWESMNIQGEKSETPVVKTEEKGHCQYKFCIM